MCIFREGRERKEKIKDREKGQGGLVVLLPISSIVMMKVTLLKKKKLRFL
jgi:hypothetical protein